MIPALVAAATLLAAPPHRLLSYEGTFVFDDSTRHVLVEIETRWVLASTEPVALTLDPSLRVARVILDGRRERWARGDGALVMVPHQKGAGDTLSVRVRYHGDPPAGGFLLWPEATSDTVTARFHVEVPPGCRALAMGELVKVDTLPRGRTVWHFDAPGRLTVAALQAAPPPARLDPPSR